MSCQGTCQAGCNVTCDSCQSCVYCQTLCELDTSQCPQKTFSFSACTDMGETIGPGYFDLEVWNEAIEQINDIRTAATYGNGSEYSLRTEKYVTADEFNSMSSIVGCSRSVNKGDLIKGSYFQEIATAVTNYKYLSTQCNGCNTGCQTCNTGCQGCDSCEGCDTQCCECCDAHSQGQEKKLTF